MRRMSKALGALFGAGHEVLFATHLEPTRWFSRTELAGQFQEPPEGLADRLRQLVSGEVLRTRGDGASAEFQANPDCPFFAEIQAMMAKAASREGASGSETILVVDDQPATLKVARILLESFGYNVIAAESAQEALILFRQSQQRIHLVLSDVVMPDITGPQLVERLQRINPDLRVIYMSGYSNEELRQKGVAFLSKPFNPAGLAKTVREVLDAD
jgi:two-component system cell cycle sensor histidine kinase/response regulator CckA